MCFELFHFNAAPSFSKTLIAFCPDILLPIMGRPTTWDSHADSNPTPPGKTSSFLIKSLKSAISVAIFYNASTLPDCISGIELRIFSMGQFHHCISISFFITSGANRLRISFAGTPPTIEYGSTSLVMTARVPIIAPSPMRTPAMINAS